MSDIQVEDDDDRGVVFAEGGIKLGLCDNPKCFDIHFGVMDADGSVFVDGKLKLEDVPDFIRDLEHLTDTLKQKAKPQ